MAMYQLPHNYVDFVKSFCSNPNDQNRRIKHEEMMAIVSNCQLDCHREHFHELMQGISDMLLHSKDCKRLALALDLLTDFSNVANKNVSEIWEGRSYLLKNLKKFSPSHFSLSIFSCKDCVHIRTMARELEKRFSFKSSSNILEEELKEKIPLSVGSEFKYISCPKCKFTRFQYQDEGVGTLFAECAPCNFSFCKMCLKDYHGPTECNLEKDTSRKNESDNFNFGSDSVKPQTEILKKKDEPIQEYGAVAKPYELEYYKIVKGKDNSECVFTHDDIATAFQSLVNISQETKKKTWPWESPKYSSYHRFANPYESLNEGNWVEDELLEKSMNNFIRLRNLEDQIGVLESFVINWSARKDYEDGEFVKIIAEKNILGKALLFALINTDINGHGGHWILGVVYLHHKKILLLDSSFVQSSTFYQKFHFYLLHILHVAQALEKKEFNASEWKLLVSLDSVQQQNAYDCGPLVVANAFAIVRNNMQLDKKPVGSVALRAWILDMLTRTPNGDNNKEQEIIKNEGKECKKIEIFCPIGLKINFEFIAGKECKNL